MQPSPAGQSDYTHTNRVDARDNTPASGTLYGLWDPDENRFLHRFELVGNEFAETINIGTMSAVVVFEQTGYELFARKMWLSHQDRGFANQLVQQLRDGYLRPGGPPFLIEVDNSTQPVLLEALSGHGLQVHSHLMKKRIDRSIIAPTPSDCYLERMRDDEAASFFAAMEERTVEWVKELTTGLYT